LRGERRNREEGEIAKKNREVGEIAKKQKNKKRKGGGRNRGKNLGRREKMKCWE